MDVFIRVNNNLIKFKYSDDTTIYQLKKNIQKKLNLNRYDFYLSVYGKILLDHYFVKEIIKNENMNNNIINLYFQNLDVALITYENKNFYTDLNMLLMSNFVNYKFDNDKEIVIFEIKKEYYNENIFKIWKKIYVIYKNLKNEEVFIPKPLKQNSLKLLDNEYFKLLKSIPYNDLIKLCNLFGYLNIDYFFKIVSAFIADEYLSKINKKNIDIFLNLKN